MLVKILFDSRLTMFSEAAVFVIIIRIHEQIRETHGNISAAPFSSTNSTRHDRSPLDESCLMSGLSVRVQEDFHSQNILHSVRKQVHKMKIFDLLFPLNCF
jgi:hypothetical protein